MLIVVIFCLLSPTYCSTKVRNGNFYDSLTDFCTNNGMNFITLATTNKTPNLQNEARKTFKTFQKHNIRVRKLEHTKEDK